MDIITFYNEVFVPTVKPLLVELGPTCQKRNNKPVEERSTANGTWEIDKTTVGLFCSNDCSATFVGSTKIEKVAQKPTKFLMQDQLYLISGQIYAL